MTETRLIMNIWMMLGQLFSMCVSGIPDLVGIMWKKGSVAEWVWTRLSFTGRIFFSYKKPYDL